MSLTSRERMLAALGCQPLERVPCSFMMFKGLKNRCRNDLDFIERQLDYGLDAVVELPPRPVTVVNDHYNLHGLPVSYDRRVEVCEWLEDVPGESDPLMVKEYRTPGGVLRAEVRRTQDWRWGNHVPFLDDYIIPRARKHLVTSAADPEALQYLLTPPRDEEIRAFHEDSAGHIAMARQRGLLLAGGWGVGADLIGWICGLENMVFLTYDQPDFMHRLLDMIAVWNRKRMEVVLSAGVDLYIKRAWYENCDFWTPRSWKTFIQPILKADVELAHQAGVRFGYILTSNAMHLIEPIMACGVDALMGVDPAQYDLERLAQTAGGKMCLWGGVNGHLTVETGAEQEVRGEVQRAVQVLAPPGGFILSPVDNIREWSPGIECNVRALVDEWQKTAPGIG